MSTSPFLSLPPELRHMIYKYYYTTPDGYFLQPISRKLAAANGKPLDLALMYTCRFIAHETRDLPLLYNDISISTIYDPELRPWAGRFDYLLYAQLQQQVKLVLLLGNLDPFRRRASGISALCEALEFTLRNLAQRATRDFYRAVNEALPDWEYSGSDRLLNFLDQCFKPWDVPHADALAEMGRKFKDERLWSTLESWAPNQRQTQEYRAKFRISAASAAIRWLSQLPANKQMCVHNLAIIEDRPSVGRQECHAEGLVPFCRANPRLRISHQVSMMNVIFSRAMLSRVGSFEGLEEYAGQEIGEQALDLASGESFSCIAEWLAEIISLSKAGMPDGSYTFTLDGGPDVDLCSEIFQQVVLRKEAMRLTIERSLPLLGEDDRLYFGLELHRGHGNAFAQLIDNSSFIKTNFNPGQLWNADKMLAEFRQIGVLDFFGKYRCVRMLFKFPRPPSTNIVPRLGALVMENYESRPCPRRQNTQKRAQGHRRGRRQH
ncbi:hypothetical protein FOC1_g10006599 [Fusarium oxysporum f. sp. cubense race 1]|uniref:F-box domain-containing protein n=1 Tax=Fusarium oxysporum f. sp. cubense (strain race 1) TaxID=1229664 RepID=N4U8Q3_FUSC1|nr:hypothetical protein FOC1_g10006599 [Fusarium oxysporum f. sp. cubense race 1]